jgi:D-beta-D-heptose 7-phosphate kinase/D-beta-D-heptose 1-phosphate adenosyltransferase
MLTRDRAEEIADRFSSQRILVVGDLMLDRYVRGTVERISPEAPVPVVHVRSERALPGGAANVALNIHALGGYPLPVGTIGTDSEGQILKSVLTERGIPVDGIVESDSVRTISKTRVLAERQQVVRVDYENDPGYSSMHTDDIAARISGVGEGATGVIIEDYGKGGISQSVVDAAMKLSRSLSIPSGFDPKDNHELCVEGITLATPNYKEACISAGLPHSALDIDPCQSRQLADAGKVLLQKWKPGNLMITLGPQGLYVAKSGAEPVIMPTKAREVFDVCGAGDTVIAVALLSIASGAGGLEAADLANHAAGIVVGKVGAATCSVEELLSVMG